MNEESSKYFSNSKEELEFYRNTYKLKVEELLSCQTKIKALENINNKLKEKNNNTNQNTSSQSNADSWGRINLFFQNIYFVIFFISYFIFFSFCIIIIIFFIINIV